MKSTATLLIAALLALSATPFAVTAFAISCSPTSVPSGSVCTFQTSSNNVAVTGVTVSFTVDNTGSNTVITVTVDTGSSGFTLHSIDEIGYGSSSQVTGVTCTLSGCNTSWNLAGQGSKTLDGYGSFLNAVQLTSGAKNDISASFTLDSLVTSFSQSTNGVPSYFGAHILLNGTAQSQTNPTGFWGGTILVAPEFPMGTLIGVIAPLAAIGAFFGLKKFVLPLH